MATRPLSLAFSTFPKTAAALVWLTLAQGVAVSERRAVVACIVMLIVVEELLLVKAKSCTNRVASSALQVVLLNVAMSWCDVVPNDCHSAGLHSSAEKRLLRYSARCFSKPQSLSLAVQI